MRALTHTHTHIYSETLGNDNKKRVMYSPDKCLCVAILFSMPLFNKASPLLAKISMNINAYSNGWQQDITCWTCAKKTDNDVCNNWAPEVLCPIRHSICKTVHRFDEVTLKTVSLTKSCSLPEQCSQSDVACRRIDEAESECISCCTESYCNEDIPYDQVTAVSLSRTLLNLGTLHEPDSSQLFIISLLYPFLATVF